MHKATWAGVVRVFGAHHFWNRRFLDLVGRMLAPAMPRGEGSVKSTTKKLVPSFQQAAPILLTFFFASMVLKTGLRDTIC